MREGDDGTDGTVLIDMDHIAREIRLEDVSWKSYGPEDISRCIRAIDRRMVIGNKRAMRVQLVGRFPTEIALSLGAYFAGQVERLEYGRPRGSRMVVFDRTQDCPEMAL